MNEQAQQALDQVQQQQAMGQFMTYGLIALFIVLFIAYYMYASKKKVGKMTNQSYFNEVMLKNLQAQITNGETLKYYCSFAWRGNMNFTFHNYYLGLTDTKMILIKVKAHLGSFTDTTDNTVVVNRNYTNITDLTIKETTITEEDDKYYKTYDIKRINFKVDGKKIDLKVKYKDIFNNEIPLDEIEAFLKQKIK